MDTDAAGIYHWSTVIRFAEEAEAELHTALGIAQATFGATPRVKAGFEFRRPLRFNDPAWIDLTVAAVGRSSVRYAALLRDEADQLVAEGEVVTVFIDTATRRSAPWPDAIRAALTSGGEQRPADREPRPGAAGATGRGRTAIVTREKAHISPASSRICTAHTQRSSPALTGRASACRTPSPRARTEVVSLESPWGIWPRGWRPAPSPVRPAPRRRPPARRRAQRRGR